MEYLAEGDFAKHIGAPLQEAFQNISKVFEGLKNIFVVPISPVWVKLGNFGVSKRILAQATTTFHTQVPTPLYSSPEVRGLDSNSETSEYANSDSSPQTTTPRYTQKKLEGY
ncbi:hypothetical protein B9Z19DRAFT_1125750 [Tuber borchii]|uniref:Uncharacterized protein n=1 Tax=Tuber borchii TaxID=42251 RepID=A0A2T6ZU69_TUBBO|nr:hypothetical protein B9Z19DRAFT_1125750 [Tuber borchii]